MSAKVAKKVVKTETVATPVQATPAPVQATPAPEESKPRRRKAEEAPPAPATPAPATATTETETVSEEESEKRRVVPTRESVEAELTSLVESVEQEVARLRDASGKAKGVKFLRVIGKRLKNLRTHALRVMKQKKTSQRKKTMTNSGFLKPVRISKELAKFTGWNEEELRSRVDVTKYICNYIKEHNLQNPSDRRQIKIDEDAKLKKLLNYDAKKEKTPLTYYTLQSHLKSHFTPVENK